MQEGLIEARVYTHGMFRFQAGIAVNGIAEDRIVAHSESFEQRRRAVPAAYMRAQFRSGLREKIRGLFVLCSIFDVARPIPDYEISLRSIFAGFPAPFPGC